MGQVVGQSSAKADEPRSDPVTLGDLSATVIHTLMDVSALRLQTNVPGNIASLLERGQPIAQLL